jgi:hypothetical protein
VDLISGIQQVGIGVKDAGEAFSWYNKTFGLNVPVFDDEAEAKLMVGFTNNIVRKRHWSILFSLKLVIWAFLRLK